MHEMSVAMSMLDLAREAAADNNCRRLLLVRVEYGVLSGIMPEALSFCFESLIRGTADEGAKLELAPVPARLRCPMCDTAFDAEDQQGIWEPCPKCGETFGHIVESGRELVLARIEASPD